jgi:hypothetical protein
MVIALSILSNLLTIITATIILIIKHLTLSFNMDCLLVCTHLLGILTGSEILLL